MGTGIIICGLNGAGKTTLGKILAEKLGFYFLDSEELYFSRTDTNTPYACPCTRQEAEKRLLLAIQAHKDFVFAAVRWNFDEVVHPFFQYAVWLEVPKDIRMQRVKSRSFMKFGSRMLPGGDLYQQEERFFDLVRTRDESAIENWAQSLRCPVIRVDGTAPPAENAAFILRTLEKR